jgi:hypothetical protein
MSARNLISLLSVLVVAGLGALPSASLASDPTTDDPCVGVFDDDGADEWLDEEDDGSVSLDDLDDDAYADEDLADTRSLTADGEESDDPYAEDTYEDEDDLGEDEDDDALYEDEAYDDDPCYADFTDDDILGKLAQNGNGTGKGNGWLSQSVYMPGPGTIDASLTNGSSTRSLMSKARVVGSRHVEVDAPGDVKLRITLTKQGKRLLRTTKRSLSLSLTTTVEFDTGRTVTRTTPVTVQPRPVKGKPHSRKKRGGKKH